MRRRRIGAYGVCLDARGRVLLVRLAADSTQPGRWMLPGGGVDHGEAPAAAVVREIAEETGLRVRVRGPRDVYHDMIVDRRGGLVHHDRLIFDVDVIDGELRDEPDGSTDAAAWVDAEELPTLPLLPFVAEALGVTPDETFAAAAESAARAAAARIAAEETSAALAGASAATAPGVAGPGGVPSRFQRFAAYGLVTDPADRVLLSRIANGYPGSGRWHLPGGGTDHGEHAAAGLLREMYEETGQRGRVTALLSVSHRYSGPALGPEGVPIDWHGVRVVFRVIVDEPTAASVMEAPGGSTAEAGWFTVADALRLPLTEIAEESISGQLAGHRRGRRPAV
ncbi:NUDIX hydrolase [Luedemannella helvata]|uniref:NUDIX hydrolase n=1 Tax=Luedemannella helvata TaxID=349315 RepID=UPI0031DEB414